jgi:hypothetical protein
MRSDCRESKDGGEYQEADADAGFSDAWSSNRQIALEVGANEHVVGRVRKEFGQLGLAVLEGRARPGRPRSSRDEQSVQKVMKRSARRRLRGSRAGARERWLGISTFLRPPSTAFCGRTNYSLIGCGPLPLARIPNLEGNCWMSWRFT